jgi:hypothetical protein
LLITASLICFQRHLICFPLVAFQLLPMQESDGYYLYQRRKKENSSLLLRPCVAVWPSLGCRAWFLERLNSAANLSDLCWLLWLIVARSADDFGVFDQAACVARKQESFNNFTGKILFGLGFCGPIDVCW